MPIWLRRFTYEKIKQHFEKQKEELDKQNNILNTKQPKQVSRPDVSPNYTAKVSKK